ncbi:O-glucosyltransferase rumi-like protein (DUF821) [Rhynchospora pubera]|uniref:O-glucosyltransferase rumi-like protein (DUF821) n=1 Tax=Rhynchospora pubera TaxID=906938 RepID=A0AAV8C3E0_9POAL|nr:O-glucosyltransferase rumi-like protein (DUF821) [Rhynchospora pubera]
MGHKPHHRISPQLRFSFVFKMNYFFVTIGTFSVLLLLFSAYSNINDLRYRTKTVVGHNLEPTPWHPFFARTDKPTAFSLIQCSYFNSCPKPTFSRFIKPSHSFSANPLPSQCPSFFSSIHKDLAPWSQSGISLPLIENAARQNAAFRVVIKDSKVYVDLLYACVQSRMLFTIWGLLQLVQRYPGLVPDVDMVFDCMDRPMVNRTWYAGHGAATPPPVFRYCTTKEHLDIPFPDWSFWGWPEVNIQPWEVEYKSIEKGSEAIKWKDRVRFAYWRGNPDVASPLRVALMSCNDTEKWQAQIFRQDWIKESTVGYQSSKLSSQCNYRYKIYAEGFAWSVSLKYILACGSETLIIDPQYEDFFSRGLIPKENFWPVRQTDLCQSIKEAVEWGNGNSSEAEAIGRRGQDLMRDINIDRVYDYMFHLLVEYSELLDFKPKPPLSAQEVCMDSLLCFADAWQREFLEKSVASPSKNYPCTLPPH